MTINKLNTLGMEFYGLCMDAKGRPGGLAFVWSKVVTVNLLSMLSSCKCVYSLVSRCA